jgi:hypothetical protein
MSKIKSIAIPAGIAYSEENKMTLSELVGLAHPYEIILKKDIMQDHYVVRLNYGLHGYLYSEYTVDKEELNNDIETIILKLKYRLDSSIGR